MNIDERIEALGAGKILKHAISNIYYKLINGELVVATHPSFITHSRVEFFSSYFFDRSKRFIIYENEDLDSIIAAFGCQAENVRRLLKFLNLGDKK